LWNVMWDGIFQSFSSTYARTAQSQQIAISLWADHFKLPLDQFPKEGPLVIDYFRSQFNRSPWNGAYDIVEFVGQHFPGTSFQKNCNRILVREQSGYRFVGRHLVPITSEEEIAAVEAATSFSDQFKPVSGHLRSALEKLSDRVSPDSRNSIKESISAVEAMCQIVTGEDGATLGQAVKRLESSGVKIHPSFEIALQKMYGYTNDAEGIRHALLDEPTLDSADALFMLVSCSAFVDYLKSI